MRTALGPSSLADLRAKPGDGEGTGLLAAVEQMAVPAVPKDHGGGRYDAAGQRIDVCPFERPEETELLLKRVHRAYNTEMNDIFANGARNSITEVERSRTGAVNLEGHGRESI